MENTSSFDDDTQMYVKALKEFLVWKKPLVRQQLALVVLVVGKTEVEEDLSRRLVFRDDMTHKYLSVDTISTDFQERLECRNKSTTTFGFDFKSGHGRVPVKSERNHA